MDHAARCNIQMIGSYYAAGMHVKHYSRAMPACHGVIDSTLQIRVSRSRAGRA